MFMYSFVFAIDAVFMAVSAIQPEIESGVLLAIVPRPVRRSDVVLGRWLGLAAVIGVFVSVTSALEFWVVGTVTDYTPPRPDLAIAFLIAESLTMLTLGLLCSTRLSPMVGGIVALVLFGVCWVGGIVRGIGVALDTDLLRSIGTATSLLLPTDGLWRSALFNLEPALLTGALSPTALAANPFLTPTGPSPEYLAWAAAWMFGVLGAAMVSFARREL
ncbi:MAG: ABC transporter permease [Dehalococcoidia bacterium]|nr:ABC transporter permease [Dehalococcoidia bacterium]